MPWTTTQRIDIAAAAVKAHASMIVTDNVRDFRGAQLAGHGIAIVTPASLISDLLSTDPNSFRVAIEQMAARKLRPPLSPDDVLDSLARNQTFKHLRSAMGEAL